MDVACESCGHRQVVDEDAVGRGPIEVDCRDCGVRRIVTRSGHAIAAPVRAPHDEPLDLIAIADGDRDRLDDLASIAKQSEVGRASRLDAEELVEIPASVRASILGALPLATPVAAPVLAEPVSELPVSAAPPPPPNSRPRRGRLAVLAACVAVVAAVAVGHFSITTEAHGTERVVAMPKIGAPVVEPAPVEVAQTPALPVVDSVAMEPVPAKSEAPHEANETPREAKREKETPREAKREKAASESRAPETKARSSEAKPPVDLMHAMQAAVKNGR